MTRKHLEAVARVVRDNRADPDEESREAASQNETCDCIALGLADVLAPLVANFERARFLRACGTLES